MGHTVICDACGQPMGNTACAACRRPETSPPLTRAELERARDRRDPAKQVPDPLGRRATDPYLTTRDCANRLGVTTEFIVAEIQDGRLQALVIKRTGFKNIYRVSPQELEAYLHRNRWSAQNKPAS